MDRKVRPSTISHGRVTSGSSLDSRAIWFCTGGAHDREARWTKIWKPSASLTREESSSASMVQEAEALRGVSTFWDLLSSHRVCVSPRGVPRA